MSSALHSSAKLGVEYVEVADEPNHVERFRNEHVRVYVATIEPGTKTLFHRHGENTLYIVLQGGLARSEEPGRQKQRLAGVSRWVRPWTKLAWLARRAISGEIRLPNSMVLMQFHHEFPLIHRVCAAMSNERPIEMLGIELLAPAGAAARLPLDAHGLAMEYEDDSVIVHRIVLAPQQSTGSRSIGPPSLLVTQSGIGALGSKPLGQGSVEWLGSEARMELSNQADLELTALLVTLR